MKRDKKIIFGLVGLLFIISILGIVYAYSLDEDYSFLEDKNNALVEIRPGWNLVPIYIHEGVKDYFPEVDDEDICQFRDFKANYVYDSANKKYISEENIPDGYFSSNAKNRFNSFFTSVWVYSDSNCFLILDEDIKDDTGSSTLVPGWNLISITPSMIGKSLGNFVDGCDVSSVYFWNNGDDGSGWVDVLPLDGKNDKIYEESMGIGLIIKVKGLCELNFESSYSSGSIPSFPQ